MAEILKTQEQFSVQAGIQGLNGVACGDAVNGFDAAGRAPSVIPAKAGIQALHGIAYGDALTALMPLAARQRVTFLCSCKVKGNP